MAHSYTLTIAMVLLASTLAFDLNPQDLIFNMLQQHQAATTTTTTRPKTSTTPAPAKCCVPDQFEGLFVTVGTHGRRRMTADMYDFEPVYEQDQQPHHHDDGIKLDIAYVSYDAKNTKIAVQEHKFNQTLKAIFDFQQKKAYYIAGQHCKTQTIKGDFEKMCVPGEAEWTTEYDFGFKQDKVTLDSFVMQVHGSGPAPHEDEGEDQHRPHRRDHVSVSFATTPSDCMIVSGTAAGMVRGGPLLSVSSVINATSGISDPSVFTPPSFCQTNNTHLNTVNLYDYFIPSLV